MLVWGSCISLWCQVLREVDGDVDAAIEFLIVEQQTDENINKSDGVPCESIIGNDQHNVHFAQIFNYSFSF